MLKVLIKNIIVEGLLKVTSGLHSYTCQPSAMRFRQSYLRYLTTVVLFTIQNNLFNLALVTWMLVGILLASCAAYIIVKLYGKVSIFIYGAAIWALLMMC